MRAKKLITLLSSSGLLIASLNSCGERIGQESQAKIAWDSANAPERIGLDRHEYERSFYQLKRSARLSQKPWSGSYWPTYRGGISYRWNHPSLSDHSRIFYKTQTHSSLSSREIRSLSPSEKLDLYVGDENYSVTNSERKRTNVMARLNGHTIPRWFGLCHAWAPATLLYESPNPITLTGHNGVKIPFGSSDVKALLLYYLNEVPSRDYFVSRRCNIDDKALRRKAEAGEISLADYTRRMESADCIGVNPGAFHIILSNMIGKKDQGFVADITRDAEVWNQAVHGYTSKVLDSRTRNFSRGADPRTVKELKVSTQMHYTTEINASMANTLNLPSQATAYYQYWIELDRNGEIIGGTWVSKERPDFLWKSLKPQFSSSNRAIQEIYEASIGMRPEDPRPEDPRPEEPQPEEPRPEEPRPEDPRPEEPQPEEPQPEEPSPEEPSPLDPIPENTRHPEYFRGPVLISDHINLHESYQKKVFTGQKFKFYGKVSSKVKKMKITYYSRNGRKISDKRVKVKRHDKFYTKAFFFDFQNPGNAVLEAFDKHDRLIDVIKFSL